ncbi:MAG: LacI family transcriptional regulator [Lachnospiraceae bacterium]|nr:LacI family transcriptional regulator [Lachnospiraceae bacterium]
MVTIRDVANKAGVSIATVSNVINHNCKVSEDTSHKVWNAIHELNYIPDYISRGAKSIMSKSIGVLIEDIQHPYTQPSLFIHGISNCCEEKNYRMQLINMNIGASRNNDITSVDLRVEKKLAASIRSLEKNSLRGVIYIAIHPRNMDFMLKQINLPLPIVMAYSFSDGVPSFISDDFQGGRIATEYLIQNGHTKIGLLSGPTNSFPAHKRFMAYQEVLMEHGLPFNPAYFYAGNWFYEDGIKACQYFCSLPDPPTAIFAMNDIMAYGILNYAHEANIRIPDDLSVIGFDNLEMSSYTYPPLTTVKLPFYEIGYQSAASLIQTLDNHGEQQGTKPLIQPIACKIINRQTVKDISAPS